MPTAKRAGTVQRQPSGKQAGKHDGSHQQGDEDEEEHRPDEHGGLPGSGISELQDAPAS